MKTINAIERRAPREVGKVIGPHSPPGRLSSPAWHCQPVGALKSVSKQQIGQPVPLPARASQRTVRRPEQVGEPSLIDSPPMTDRRRGRTPLLERVADRPAGRGPDRPTLDGIGERWARQWEADGTYRFDRSRERGDIDRHPSADRQRVPPWIGLRLRADGFALRYRAHARTRGFYPMGWDDNGLCNRAPGPELLRRPLRSAPPVWRSNCRHPPKDAIAISRPNFLELCARLVAQDEQAFEELWRGLGLSVDWSLTYTTVGTAARRTSQRAAQPRVGRGVPGRCAHTLGRRYAHHGRAGRARRP